ncbi:hypothetical protein FRC00_009133, partial [Tulasnella sp. 408]
MNSEPPRHLVKLLASSLVLISKTLSQLAHKTACKMHLWEAAKLMTPPACAEILPTLGTSQAALVARAQAKTLRPPQLLVKLPAGLR